MTDAPPFDPEKRDYFLSLLRLHGQPLPTTGDGELYHKAGLDKQIELWAPFLFYVNGKLKGVIDDSTL